MPYSNKCGVVTVYDSEGNAKRKEPPLTDAELKKVLNGGLPHKNSIAEKIKNNPELLAKYQANRTKYLDDYEATMAQYDRGINSLIT